MAWKPSEKVVWGWGSFHGQRQEIRNELSIKEQDLQAIVWKASLFPSEGSGPGPLATNEDSTCLDFLLIFLMAHAKLTGAATCLGSADS